MPTAFSKFFVKSQAVSTVSDVLAPLTEAITKLKTVHQQQADLALSKQQSAEQLRKEAGQHQDESNLALSVAKKLEAIAS